MITPEVKLLEQLDKRLGGPATWRAQQTDWKKAVIVQVASHGRIEEELLDAFLTTCALAQEVETDRIAHIHDFGVYEDKLPFVVVEMLEGRSLEQHLKKQRRLGVSELAPLARQLAEAFDGAHAFEVSHHRLGMGDIVLRKGADMDAVVRGFGIGLLSRASKSDDFVSPEIFAGKEADYRADLWSLAAILYKAIIGRNAVEAVERRLGKWSVELPRVVVAKALRERLEPIFVKALAEDPGSRYGTAEDMVNDILSGIAAVTGNDQQARIVEVTEESLPPPAPDDDEELDW